MTIDLAPREAAYRVVASCILLAVLLWFGLLIINPFIPAMVLGLIFAVATWPAFSMLKERVGNITLASALMTLALALIFIVPFFIAGNSLAHNYAEFYTGIISILRGKNGGPPLWLTEIPYLSGYVHMYWADYGGSNANVEATVNDNMGVISEWLLAIGTSIGAGLTALALGVFFSFFIFRHGIEAIEGLHVLLDRFIGPRAQRLLIVSRKTIVSIIYGLLGTALAQAIIAGFGFWIAGVPGAVVLAGLIFILSPIPLGPPLVWIPAVLWLFAQQQTGMAIFMFLWGLLAISAIDNVLRPYIISHGSKLPLLLAFLGVLGGILAFGFIGMFIGPTILAVIYVLLLEEIQPENVVITPQPTPA